MGYLRLMLLGVLAWYSFSCSAAPAVRHRLKVVTSFLPVYSLTANIAGDLAEVENLLPANVEPHDYQFSRKELQKLVHADLVVVNGLGLEKWMEKAVANNALQGKRNVIEMARGVPPTLLISSQSLDRYSLRKYGLATARSDVRSGNAPNPHIWLDPSLARYAVTNILEALQAADPAHATDYLSNASGYLDKLARLDAELREGLAPIKGTPIVTYHDAFAYFARHYDLRVIGVVEPTPDFEPSLRYMTALYHSIRSNDVTVLFTQPPAPSRLARQIADDLRLSLVQLDTLETGPITPEAYEAAMRTNLRALLRHFKPDAQRASR